MACPSRWCWCTCWCTLVLAVLSARSAPAALATPERLVGPPRPYDLLRPRPALGQAGDPSYRLPGDAHPLHYDIHIGSNLDKLFFLGTVDITLQVDKLIEKGKPLTLHADGSIDIDPSNKCTLDGNEVDHELSKDGKDFIRFTAKTDLMAGTVHVLHCEYRGKIFEDDKGFYRSQYDGKGVKINIGVTQFEMTFARRALPCFDEPGYRATFALAITHHVEESAISNTQPAVIVSVNATHAKTTFEATPAMAVYTLAWLVSRMPSVASADGDFPFATYAQPKYIEDTSLSQSVGPQVLAGMAEYTGIEYALDKMDQAALPDFNFGAMENWGLVTYRQGLLLAGADSRSTTNLSVTTTIAHELAHQWFGNLVTPSWWGHVWLSEAFAELFCYLMTDKINPEWKVLDKMPLMEMHDAFVEDSLISSAPMTNENIYTPDEILDNFGSITYAKGSSVLRMLRDTMDSVSADSFRKGLQSYLNAKKQSGVVEPDDLWHGLESVGVTLPGGLSVTDLGKKWTEQAGYPVITVTRTGDTASVAQVRFLSEEPANPPTSVTWPVPLTWKAPGTTVVSRSFLTEESGSISGIPKDGAWVLFNVDQLGYYRVNYDNDGWKALTDTLVSDVGSLTVPERAMLVDDALTLARAGKLSYETALSLQGYLVAERQYAPWAAFASSVEYLALHCRAAGGEIASLFDRWVAGLTEKAYHDLDFSSSDKDTFEDKLTRSVVVQVAFEANLFQAVTDASLAFLDSRMEPDTARLALCKGLTDSHTDEVYKDLLKKLKLSTDEMKRRDYTYALGCAPENEEVQLKTELLTYLTSDDVRIDARDIKALWTSLAASDLGVSTALKYIAANAATIIKNRGKDEMITILSTLASRIVTQENRGKLAELKIADIGDDVLNGFLATADVNLAWGNTYLASVESYLDEAVTTVDPTASTTPTTPTVSTGPTVPTTSTAAPTPSPDSYRLPSSISPSAYILHLAITGFDSFNGSVTVDFLALDEDVKSVVMHASDLTIGKVRVFEKYTGKDVVVEGVKSSPEVEQISINLAEALQPGITTYSVTIDYTGPVRTDFTGLYHTTIGDGDLIGTQMYPAYARRVLPCFDEPHFRTPFKLNVLHEQNLVAVSSSANLEARRALRRGLRTAIVEDDYEVTTNIPLAQVGLFLVDYREYNKEATDGMTLVGRKELVDAAKSSGVLAQAQTLMWWFGNASGVAAAPAHLNLLGLTSSLDDAVSTWGLVAMRERNMADMDTSPSSGDSEQNWLTQLARTLSQIWFGGMVSPDWWSSAWLSEGFATFFQYSVPASLQPTWQLTYQMYTRAIAPALHADSFEGAHPLNADVSGSQETIADALDVIASGKGGAVVQMLSHVLEDNNAFDAGLKAFFKDGEKLPHTTVPDELYAAMDKAAKQVNADTKLPAGATLKEAIGTWVDGSGYPVVNVIRDYNAKKATISQERFLLHSPSSSQQSLSGSWWVPLSYALRSEYMSIDYTPKVPLKTWLAPGQDLTIDLADNSDWLLVNADRREFFRVNYDIRNWKMLGDYMLEYHQLVETVARAMLVDDALALSRSGRLDYPVALKFLDYLRLDVDLAPWEAARRGFDYLDAQLLGSRHEAVYKTWLLQLLDTAVEEAGFVPEDRDSHTQRLTRAVVTAWACDLGQESCTRYAKRDFDTWITEPNGVSHDTLAAVVCVGLRNGDADTLKTVTARLAAEEDDAQRAAIIQGLGCGGNVHALFDLTVRPGLRRGEPALLWGSATRFRPADVTQSMHCFTNMHKRVAAQYGKASIVDIARVLANRVTTQTQLDLLTALVSDIDASLLQGALLLAKDNVAWREDNLDTVADVLYELTNTPDPDLPTSPTTSTTTTTTMTIPTGPVPTDPATVTASTGTTSTWTLPPSVSTSKATLPTLDPVTVPPGTGPTDPATGSTASTGTYFTLPPTSPTTPVTLPPVPGPSSTSPATTATPGPPPTPVVPTEKPNSSSGLATNTALLLAGIVAIILH